MSSNKSIQRNTIVYIIIYFFALVIYFDTAGYHGDAAGNAMKYGFLFIQKLIVCIAAGIITIINRVKLKKATGTWIKLIAFIPVALALILWLI